VVSLNLAHPVYTNCPVSTNLEHSEPVCLPVLCLYSFCINESWLITERIWLKDPHWSVEHRYLVAVYFTIVTITATGFGDVYPVESFGFLTVTVTIVVGFIVFSYTLSVLAATLANHDAPKYDYTIALLPRIAFYFAHSVLYVVTLSVKGIDCVDSLNVP